MIKKLREKKTSFKDKKETYIHWRKTENVKKKKKRCWTHGFNFKSAIRIHKTNYNI